MKRKLFLNLGKNAAKLAVLAMASTIIEGSVKKASKDVVDSATELMKIKM